MALAPPLRHLLLLSALLLLVSACATDQSLVGKATGKYCTESDNGNNKDVPGTMRYSELRNGVWTDFTRTDSCEPDGRLKEYWCNPADNGTKVLHTCACEMTATGAKCKATQTSGCSRDLDCDTFQRCDNGVCRDDPASKDYQCRDDDGGWNPYKKGIVEQARERREDSCESSTLLREWFCEQGAKPPFTSVMTYRYEGKYGYICENGALKVDPTLRCVDDDYDPYLGGKNPQKGGTTRLTVNGRTQAQPDRCMNAAKLVEYACIGSGATVALQYYEIDCDWRSETCVVNQCVRNETKRCVDSDGNNIFTPGVVTDDGRNYPDRCDSLGRIIEWYCKNEYEGDQKPVADCPYNYVCDATKGACVLKSTAPPTAPTNTTNTTASCTAFNGYIELGKSREFDSCAFGNTYLRKTSCVGNEPRAEFVRCPTQCIQARCY